MSQEHSGEHSTQTQIRKPRRTNSPRFNPDEDGKRRATFMRRVHQVRTKGERLEVSFDAKGQPIGKGGDALQSWIGVLAREHIPIWISDFRSVDLAQRKKRVWTKIVTSFTVGESYKKQALKSCAASAKNFRYDLYQAFVRDHIDKEAILSEQGSEIRKKLKYGSTGGRDGYRKRDQAHFEKTGKYAERHENWLNMRVKPDGSLKNEAYDFSEQQTQGSFESVGTEDILTKALGNAEHSGRIRGQSKFVKQSQYFNVAGSYHKNAEVLDMKRQLATLERIVQELCAKHGINQETMAEEQTAPTVDQHNSFKASCTLNEKGAEASDPKTMPNASKECHLFLPDLINGGDVLAATGRAYMECVPTDTIHGIPLGEENVRVTITVPKLKGVLLPIPTHEAISIEEAVGGFVPWLKRLVIVQTSLSQASKGPSHAPNREAEGSKRTKKRAVWKKIRSQPEVQQQRAQEEMPSFDFSDIPFDLKSLAYYAQNSMRDGTQIICHQQQFVIGDDMPIYIGFEDVYHLITFKEISVNSITIYIRYLADCCARAGMDQRFEFISPVIISLVQRVADRAAYVQERADYILQILRNAPQGKLFLMPYNSGQHWVLEVIDPWDDLVLYFNPLENEPDDDFKDLITTALNDWKISVGRGEGYVECGYFVLAFMREITLTIDGLVALQTKDFYTDADMSLVRQE
ncbi:hypothetical protein TIFTF001_032113 [Ficus carica]|uniref:Ubiquitin-like protease family profile domain-containing protein n=1 Tax=Ficus carica TaxID=3494 RepID=A0AA88E2S4_FICCA|nr:hypothetical protein TIFTF001_032113 [Ficus carica]